MSRTSVVLNTLQNVQLFMTQNAGALGALNTSASRTALDDLEASLSGHASNQTSAASGTTAAIARQRVLRNTMLVRYLRPISAIADMQLGQSPDCIALQLPRSIRSTQQLLAAAESIGAVAARYAGTFIAAGMAPTFVSDLETAAADFKASAAIRNLTLTSQIGATSGLRSDTKQAHKIVKALDALVEPMLANNPALLSQWKATKRFSGRPTVIASAMIDSAVTVSVNDPATAAPSMVATPATSATSATSGGATAA